MFTVLIIGYMMDLIGRKYLTVGGLFMASLATLQSVAATLNADCVMLREKVIENERKAAQYLVRLKADEKVTIILLRNMGNASVGRFCI